MKNSPIDGIKVRITPDKSPGRVSLKLTVQKAFALPAPRSRAASTSDHDDPYHFDDSAIPQGHQCERSGGTGMIKTQNNEIEVLDPKMQGETDRQLGLIEGENDDYGYWEVH